MRLAFIVVASGSAVAHAQAPGVVSPIATPDPLMTDRWAAGVSLGSETLTPRVSGANGTGFGIVELAVRYRIVPQLELAAALIAGGADQLATAGLYVDARYRFRPHQPWNWFLLGGLGVASAAASDGSSTEKRGRGSIRVGAGLERRFRNRLAIEAELRIIGIAHDDAVPEPATTDQAYEVARFGLSGGSLTVGTSYYF